MIDLVHIPSDEEVGLNENNSKRRAIFLCACALCKKDYEVRDGKWLDTFTRRGTKIRITICPECFEEENVK